MVKIADLRLDETTWTSGSQPRRSEWRVLLEDLVDNGRFAPPLERHYLLVTPTRDAVLFEALDEDGQVREECRLSLSVLEDTIGEYAAIIRRLDTNGDHYDTARYQAIDMAKRVVHDRAVGILARTIAPIATDEPTLRLLFSLVFALRVDTTTMHHARGHRSAR